jgi:hypothetical protein
VGLHVLLDTDSPTKTILILNTTEPNLPDHHKPSEQRSDRKYTLELKLNVDPTRQPV